MINKHKKMKSKGLAWLIVASAMLMSCSFLAGSTTWNAYNAGALQATYFYFGAGGPFPVPAGSTYSFDGIFSSDYAISIGGASGATLILDTVGVLNAGITFANSSSTLDLSQDLQCGSAFSLNGNGIINGNSKSLMLSTGLSITTTITLGSSNLTIDGNGNRVTVRAGGSFALGSNTLTLKNMDLILRPGTPFSNASGSLKLENVNVYLSGTSVSSLGAVEIAGLVRVSGQSYSLSSSAITVDANSILLINTGVTLSMPASSSISMLDASSRLVLDGCTFDTSAAGDLTLTNGMLVFNNQVLVKATGHTLTLGGSGDVLTRVNSGACVIVDGTLYHNPA